MRKGYFKTILYLVLPIAILRTLDLILNIDFATGFAAGRVSVVRIAGLTTIPLICWVIYFISKKKLGKSEDEETRSGFITGSGLFASMSYFVSGILTAVSFALKIYDMRKIGYANECLTSTCGFIKFVSILDILSLVFTILTALWFFLVSSWLFRGEGPFAGGGYYSVVVALWLYLRVSVLFLKKPVNPNDINTVILILGLCFLALFYTAFAKTVSIGYLKKELPSLVSLGLLSYLWVTGLSLPTAYVYFSSGDMMSMISLLADASVAISAIAAILYFIKTKSPVQKTQ
ncbi:MAG: hypothetical protein GX222_00400 [Ruminococcaceae bacterium]|nr:hypothetical protein [Oscillospiraceae bacterium]